MAGYPWAMDGVLAAAGDNARAPLSGARAYEHLFAYGYGMMLATLAPAGMHGVGVG